MKTSSSGVFVRSAVGVALIALSAMAQARPATESDEVPGTPVVRPKGVRGDVVNQQRGQPVPGVVVAAPTVVQQPVVVPQPVIVGQPIVVGRPVHGGPMIHSGPPLVVQQPGYHGRPVEVRRDVVVAPQIVTSPHVTLSRPVWVNPPVVYSPPARVEYAQPAVVPWLVAGFELAHWERAGYVWGPRHMAYDTWLEREWRARRWHEREWREHVAREYARREREARARGWRGEREFHPHGRDVREAHWDRDGRDGRDSRGEWRR